VDQAWLIGQIDQQRATEWTGEAWRHVAAARAPMSGEGARIAGGRWNPPASFAVLYLGLDQRTVIAEFHRLASRQGLSPVSFLPRKLYRYEGRFHSLLDLRPASVRESLGLTTGDVSSHDPTACRAVGEAAYAAGREGILAPSATGSGDVLAVFLERLSPLSAIRDVGSELWEQVPDLPET
jgi:RES domain-containing protein